MKTLDILGKTKSFAKLSVTDLAHYCELARSKYQCTNSSDTAAFLEDRYGWEVELRQADLQDAWDSINAVSDEDEVSVKSESGATGSKSTPKDLSDIPIIIKSNAMGRPVLICEVDDEHLHFAGDSGAVGRIFCDPTSLRLDLKGRQYTGQLLAGPTMMILNFAPPVGQSSSAGKDSQLCARAESVTNEFCHLDFEKDLHGTMQGVYTGDEVGDRNFGDDNNSDSDDAAPSSKQKKAGSSKKAKISAKSEDKDGGANPKISTITQRKRKSSGSSKKTSSSSKKSK